MRKLALLGTAALLAFGVEHVYAMGGSGNLSPSESPYAILEPQTLGAAAHQPAPPPDEQPAPVRHRRERK